MKGQTLAERFWSRVDKNGPTPAHAPHLGPCWVWLGAMSHGYGYLWCDGGDRRVNRLSYAMHRGPIPSGHVVMHLCDNRACVRPEHLEVGTARDNTQDMMQKRRNRTSDVALTDGRVVAARAIYASGGASAKALAMELGVSPALLSKALRGQSPYHELPGPVIPAQGRRPRARAAGAP